MKKVKKNRNHKALRIDNVSGCFNRFGEKKNTYDWNHAGINRKPKNNASPYDLNESGGFNDH